MPEKDDFGRYLQTVALKAIQKDFAVTTARGKKAILKGGCFMNQNVFIFFRLRLRRPLRSAYDIVKTRLSKSEAEVKG